MKFRYYITDLFEGCVVGTNDPDVAAELAECEEDFVVDSQEGKWLLPGGKSQDVTEANRAGDD